MIADDLTRFHRKPSNIIECRAKPDERFHKTNIHEFVYFVKGDVAWKLIPRPAGRSSLLPGRIIEVEAEALDG